MSVLPPHGLIAVAFAIERSSTCGESQLLRTASDTSPTTATTGGPPQPPHADDHQDHAGGMAWPARTRPARPAPWQERPPARKPGPARQKAQAMQAVPVRGI